MLNSSAGKLLFYVTLFFYLSGCGESGGDDDFRFGAAPDQDNLSVAISSNVTSVGYNEAVTIQWTSTDADRCVASGDWAGVKAASGQQVIDSLTSDSAFILTCSGAGASVSDTLNITVAAPTLPQITLTANPVNVSINGSATISWTSTNASSCSASGDWAGSRATSGTETLDSLIADSSFILTCSGAGGSASDSVNVTVGAPSAPGITLSASPAAIPYNGSTTLNWSSSNASNCMASGDWSGSRSTTGSQTIDALTKNSSFILFCSGSGGSVSETVSVNVGVPPAPTLNLVANPVSVSYMGTATISWASTNASSCTASGGWSGSRPASGSEVLSSLTVDADYILTCSGAGGRVTDSVTVMVGAAPAPVLNLSISAGAVPYNGSSTISWTSSNASSCSASGGWSGSRPTSGTETMNSLSADASYTLTCSGAGGSVTDSVGVSVAAPPAPAVNLSASPISVPYNGSSTISWTSSNASSCNASGAWSGSRPASGSETMNSLSTSSNFILACSGAGGSSTGSVSVSVGTPPAPTVNLSATPASVPQNGSTTLSWTSTNASACTASGGWSGSKAPSGSQVFSSLNSNMTFNLDCSGAGGSAADLVAVSIVALPVPTIALTANITADDVIDANEAAGLVAITGSVGGDAKAGDTVSISVNGVNVTGIVQNGNTFSVNVSGSSLVADMDRTVVGTIISTDAHGNSASASDSETFTVNLGGSNGNTLVCPDPLKPCYDIIYVRYPIAQTAGGKVSLPAGENAYPLERGADLMLLRQDGSEIVLVDCTDCSVMDPFISYDGKTVYYSYNEYLPNMGPYGDKFASWIYKIHLQGHVSFNNYEPIRLTYDDGFDSVLYKGNQEVNGNIKSGHDQGDWRSIRDMAPVPLADGRLLFTSNRSALTAFHSGTDAAIRSSVQQLYVMDDHDGKAITRELANMQRLETGNIHQVQHPLQLKDGRILFSSWQDVGTKFEIGNFQYAMTSLFTVNPDGSNLKQFTEPHDHQKNVEHFVSQLSDEQVVWGQYYPLAEGYGVIMRAPVNSGGAEFLRGSVSQTFNYGSRYPVSYREFDRVGTVTITPHTSAGDVLAPNSSGKYSMPSAVNDGDLLVAYSGGTVNQTEFVCAPTGQCEALRSGIYLIKNADGNEADFIADPAQLILVKDDPAYNEIWPRAVLSYQQIYGQAAPNILNNLATSLPEDVRLQPAEANALLGTSSMYNRESLNEADPDPFHSLKAREWTDGNWTVQGAEAGVFSNADIYGVRIIATPPKPFTRPIDAYAESARWNAISRHLLDNRLANVVARYGSDHGERWEILGEFPVKKAVTDTQGNPDTSWLSKIPADTPTFIQTIDSKGMTLVSELAWRALKPGEKRADCGGCHAHSVAPLDFASTEAGKNKPVTNVVGVATDDERVKDGIWDLTLNSIPLLNETGVTFKPGYSYGVEFNRDIVPILNNRCVSCHRTGGSGDMLILNNDPWSAIAQTGADSENVIQVSRYIRMPQARQSLLVWATWGERLDGRSNATRTDDIDFPGHPAIPGITDEEKRTIARWVDLGSPIDFPSTDGMGYTDDYQLPVVNIYTPFQGSNNGAQIKVGFNDAHSGIDWSTLSVKYFKIDAAFQSQMPDPSNMVDVEASLANLRQLISSVEQSVAINVGQDVNAKNVLTRNLSLGPGEYVLSVSVKDVAGNSGVASRRFSVN